MTVNSVAKYFIFEAMKTKICCLITLLCSYISVFSSSQSFKHEWSISWGWNRDYYSKSDLRLQGSNYNFTLHKIKAFDRQSHFGYNPYFKLDQITIPQYNFRLGYFFKNHWQLSFGFDHMKYVMKQNQIVSIDGSIANTGLVYDGIYNHQNIKLSNDFLMFEHTDGLNYLNLELRRKDNIICFNKKPENKYLKVDINAIAGIGAGLMYPRTNSRLLNNSRYDEFHLAGYGFAPVVGLQISFLKYFFIQSEIKGGYINMPNIRITYFPKDIGKQHFWFLQENVSFGIRYLL